MNLEVAQKLARVNQHWGAVALSLDQAQHTWMKAK